MVHGYHYILSAYGFWLPNDPRGSWSEFVGAWELFRHGGAATKVSTTESVAHVQHNRQHRLEMKHHLKRKPVIFNGQQAVAIGKGFGEAAKEGDYSILACAILPEHCHLIIARHERPVGQISAHLKGRATQELKGCGLWDHEVSPWGVKYWAVFIDQERWMQSAIRYAQNNPMKEGKRPQRWSFVRPIPS